MSSVYPSQGYVVKRSEKRASTAAGQPGELLVFDEFHPYPFRQFASKQVDEYPTFNKVNTVACDDAYGDIIHSIFSMLKGLLSGDLKLNLLLNINYSLQFIWIYFIGTDLCSLHV